MRCRLKYFLPLVLLALSAGACGLPSDETATAIDVQTLPVELQPDATTTTTTEPLPASRDVTLYYLNDKTLVPRVRSVPREASIKDELQLLFDFVPDESNPDDDGLRSDVALLTLIGVDITDDGTARINIERTDEDTAYTNDQAAQLVFSATCRRDVERVEFQIDGQGAIVNTVGDLTEPGGQVTREDYSNYIALRSDDATCPD